MGELVCKTWHDRDPRGLIRTLFVAQEEDFTLYYEELTDLLLSLQKNLAIYHAEHIDDISEEVLLSMQLVIAPITMAFLHPNCAERIRIFDEAIRLHVPVLPIQKQKGIGRIFSEICGKRQILDATGTDRTRIDFKDQLARYLEDHLVDETLSRKIRNAFQAYIFLSYRKKDRKHANEIMHLIHENEFMRDVAIWYDEYLVPGEEYNEAIADALLKSRLVALLVTPNLVNEDNYVQRVEYPEAKRSGKSVLPIEAEPTDFDQMQSQYDGIDHPVRVSDRESLTEALAKAFEKAGMERTSAGSLAEGGMKEDDDPEHLYFIGLAYLMGIDVEVDRQRAVDLLYRAHRMGYYEAGRLLVDCYLEGRYFTQDYTSAEAIQREMIEACASEMSGDRESCLHYADMIDKYVKIFTDVGIYEGNVAPNEKAIVGTLKKMAEEYPMPGDEILIAMAQKDYVEILSHLPGNEEEIGSICAEIYETYADCSNRYGYSLSYDVMRLANDFTRYTGDNWFQVGFRCMEIYGASFDDMKSEDQVDYLYSGTLLWLEYVEYYNRNFLEKVGNAGNVEETEEEAELKKAILSDMEDIAQAVALTSQWLTDAEEEEKRDNLRQRFFKSCGTFSVIVGDFDAAKQFFVWAFDELKGRYDSPEIMLSQVENLKNLILLGDGTGNRRMLHMAHWALDDLYDTLYQATGVEEYNEAMMDNLAQMKVKNIKPDFNGLSDAQWDAIERLIPLLGKEKEWEVSRNRHHERCLWEREEDAPFLPEEAIRALKNAMIKPLSGYPLSAEDKELLKGIL